MSHDKAVSLFSGKNVPEELAKSNAEKLLAALSVLGEKYILARPVQRLAVPRSF
jgi:hypothetical protein